MALAQPPFSGIIMIWHHKQVMGRNGQSALMERQMCNTLDERRFFSWGV